MAVVGILPAAGSGERLGASGPKAFALCGGRPLLDWSLEVLGSVCDRVVVAVPAGYEEGADRVVGGASRSASVRAALAAALETTFGSRVAIELQAGGMHLLARFRDAADDTVLARRAIAAGLAPTALSGLAMAHECGQGLLLSFTNIAESEADILVRRLAVAMAGD